jgi:Uma2 family endonuclease
MTAEDLPAIADDEYSYELIDGELIRLPPAGGDHGEVSA